MANNGDEPPEKATATNSADPVKAGAPSISRATKSNSKPKFRKRNIERVQQNINFRNDLIFMINKLMPSSSTWQARDAAFLGVKELVSSLCPPGELVEVVDVSMGAFGAPDMDNSPLEIAIVDRARPEGLTPDMGDQPVPLFYHAMEFSRALARAGIAGYFEDFNPLLNASNSSYIHRVSWEAGGTVPEYTPLADSHAVLQPAIYIPRSSDERAMIIHLAHPSSLHRFVFIREHMKNIASLPLFTLLFWILVQSWGVSALPPSTCALWGIHILQDKFGYKKPVANGGVISLPYVSIFGSNSIPDGFWQRYFSGGTGVKYSRTFTIRAPTELKSEKEIPAILLFSHLFKHLSSEFKVRAENVFCIRSAKTIPRSEPHQVSAHSHASSAKNLIHEDAGFPAVANKPTDPNGFTQPFFWRYNPVVVQDPFVPLHNTTNLMSVDVLKAIVTKASMVDAKIKKGLPLAALFETEYLIKLSAASQVVLPTLPLCARTFFVAKFTPSDVLTQRAQIIQRVQTAVQHQFGREYTVECFGSTRYGVDSPTSDLDLVVVDHNRLNGFSPLVTHASLPHIYDIQSLASCVRANGFHVTQRIPHANVPIVKFMDTRTGINCDINVNDQLGMFNTRLIARYCEISPVLRPLLMALKQWAKPLGLNNPSGRGAATSFSSYALTLMTISFLQLRGLLPNLQSGLAGLPVASNRSAGTDGTFWLRSKNNVRQRCDYRFNPLLGWTAGTGADANLGEGDVGKALYEWFKFFAYQHKYEDELLSIQYGGLLPRTTGMIGKKTRRRKESKKERIARQDKEKRTTGNVDGPKGVVKHSESSPSVRRENANTLEEFIESVESDLAGLTVASATSELDIDSDDEASENEEDALDTPTGEEPGIGDPDAMEEAALEYCFDDIDLPGGKHPAIWDKQKLVVVDPFIPTKNVVGAINKNVMELFIQECRRAVFMLELGCTFAELVGPEIGYREPGPSRQQGGGGRGQPRQQYQSRGGGGGGGGGANSRGKPAAGRSGSGPHGMRA